MPMEVLFPNRAEAGRSLAKKLSAYSGREDVIVLGLPRGGMPVAYEVARALGVALDVFVVRKLGVPGFEELALGAIASGGVRVLNEDVVNALPNAQELIDSVTTKELAELQRREASYRDGRPAPELAGRTVILVDDGLATGATMRAAVEALRQRAVARIVVGVPVGAAETCREFEREVDEMVCVISPEWFQAVGQYYEDFSQVSDADVREFLVRAAAETWHSGKRHS
ncbi:MAG: putative phosphoribosyl transferase [Verrucomicrobiota bacterium]|jgi:predicted phosphoribosyltransferase